MHWSKTAVWFGNHFSLLEPNHFFFLIQGLFGCKQRKLNWVGGCCSNIYAIKILDCAEWGRRELNVSTLLTLTYCIAKLSHRYLYMACWIEINHFTYKFQLMNQHFFSLRMRGADKEAQHYDQKNTWLKQQQLRQIFSETSLDFFSWRRKTSKNTRWVQQKYMYFIKSILTSSWVAIWT